VGQGFRAPGDRLEGQHPAPTAHDLGEREGVQALVRAAVHGEVAGAQHGPVQAGDDGLEDVVAVLQGEQAGDVEVHGGPLAARPA
jgi:hypothetical protein